ncbi:hypothetical protein KKA95_03555 [Patescibacteria group bacterium]|nr:hypothetical protein [Patescibacteria group bacterium]
MTKKTSHWVTISEEAVHTPASKSTKRTQKSESTPVKNKLFWGAGFVVLVLLTVALIAPNQMASILQGNLFDQGLIPEDGFEDPQASQQTQQVEEVAEEEVVEEEVTAGPEIDLAVEAQTEAVTIQIDPVGTTEEQVVEQEAQAEEGGTIQEELDANQKLLQELSQQIAEFKEKDEEKTKIIEDLAEIVQEDLHAAAADTATEATATIGTTTSTTTTTGYRVNTHTVTMTPHEALAINTAQYASAQATYDGVTVADYSAQLSSATGTPDSGPKEILLVAFILTFVSLLGWRLRKIVQA